MNAEFEHWRSERVNEAVRIVETNELRAQNAMLRDVFGQYLGPTGNEGDWLPRAERAGEWWCALPTQLRIELRREWLMWNEGAIPKLTRAIYENEQFDRLPALADTLETAGCTERAILDHLRGTGPHFRGCWVLDLLMDRGFAP
jgi:hypothetical protein